MSAPQGARLGLGDFRYPDSDSPLDPGGDYTDWKREAQWVFDLFEPALAEGPVPRTRIASPSGGGSTPVINLASYNYLGLGQHPEVIAAAVDALRTFGTGACGSPVLSGMTVEHQALERELADFTGRERAMLFNSGNAGAIGTLAAVLRRGDVAILDQYAHVCLIEGARLGGAKVEFFLHNDPADLDQLLAKYAGKRRLVCVEGIYSMHGDYGDLARLAPVVRAHGADLMVDEAHSMLAVGPTGRGAAELFGVEGDVALTYGTFSKSFANIGAVLAGSARTMDYVRWFANTYVFSAALPPAVAAGVRAALRVARATPALRDALAANADYFRAGLHTLGVGTGESASHVIPIVVGSDRALLYELTATLRERGVFVAPVDYPSVPEHELRLRSCVTAAHTRRDLDDALTIVEDVVVPRLRRAGTLSTAAAP